MTYKKLAFKDVHLDHCHTTGKFRGNLCENCNLGLGRFKDSIDNLNKAIDYLQKTDNDPCAIDIYSSDH